MAFVGKGGKPISFETDEAEAARLGRSPEGSTYGRLAALPVTNPWPQGGQLVELPLVHGSDDQRIVVLVGEERSSRPVAEDGTRLRSAHYQGIVVASTAPSYPVGGYDISVCEEELRRGLLISPEQLLAVHAGSR